MTELLTRPPTARADAAAVHAPASIWWRGVLAALWAVALGLATLVVIVLLAWAADSRAGASAGQAVRTALQIWLAAHKTPLHVPGGTIALAPLLLTLALAFLVARAAAVLARGQDVHDALGVGTVALAVGLPYATLSAFVAAAARSAHVGPAPLPGLVAGFLVGTLAAAWGAARGAGIVRELWRGLPQWLRVPIGAGGAALGTLTAGGLLLVLVAFVLHLGTATASLDTLGGGVVGAAAIVVLDLVLLPNAAVCAVGYLAGPGFAVGAGTSVTLTDAQVGRLPTLPLMATVPHRPASLLVVVAAIAVLVVAGVLVGWWVAREGAPLLRSMAFAAGAGVAAGVGGAVLAAIAGGPAGPGQMTSVGVSPWQLGLVVAAEVAVVAAGVTGALTWRRGR